MSSESEDNDDFTPTVITASDQTDSLDFIAEEREERSNACMFIVYNIYY